MDCANEWGQRNTMRRRTERQQGHHDSLMMGHEEHTLMACSLRFRGSSNAAGSKAPIHRRPCLRHCNTKVRSACCKSNNNCNSESGPKAKQVEVQPKSGYVNKLFALANESQVQCSCSSLQNNTNHDSEQAHHHAISSSSDSPAHWSLAAERRS